MARLITLRTFDNYVTAHIVKSRLEAEGMACVLQNEHTIAMQWHMAEANGRIRLQVAECDKAMAEHVLAVIEQEALAVQSTIGFWDEEDIDQLDPNNRICIHCGSKNTRKEDYSKRPAMLRWLLQGFASDKWHCFHCGADF
ncbi:putative signal transducing protein [Taibaiella koreensis]|uniref:putative signal transducing protein n=1 Tax=Taibaiella koreensis TaxID=1268548 RepID=UPI000E59EA4A|nr:DUF2007 domain-containing protein [Taibaiella koreensis]